MIRFREERPATTAPAAHESWVAVRDGGVAARASLWFPPATPAYHGRRVGYIGSFAADDDASARALLDHGCARIRSAGAEIALGPIDGSTWRSYRAVIASTDEPAFFMESPYAASVGTHFARAGFRIAETYHSASENRLDVRDPRARRGADRLASAGVRIRTLADTGFETAIRAIYDVSIAAFADNVLFTPLACKAFLAMYAPSEAFLDPRIVLVAEHDGRAVGFAFANPDPSVLGRAVVKTVARRPEAMYAGLGVVLSDEVRHRAADAGYRSAIHALMHDANTNASLSKRFATIVRRYALFARDLSPEGVAS